MKNVARFYSIAVSLLILAAAPAPSFAQTTSASSTPATNISNEYNYFLKNVNSRQVVNDLRNGQWTTTTTDPNTKVTTTTTEALPTGKMGYGNVKISLALAQESLRQQQILQPTSEQLHTALVGGQMVQGDPATTTTGILQMRAAGMGWGQIAQKYNVKLGQLMSGKQPASTTTTTTTSTTDKGIATASGKSSTTVTGKDNGKAFSGSDSQDRGIVSASGQTSGSSSVSHGSRGIVSGSGRSVGHTSGMVTGGGNGHQYGASGGGHSNAGGAGRGPK